MITQDELHTFRMYTDTLKKKQGKMDLVKAKLGDMETSLLIRLDAGEEVEIGKRRPTINESERRTVGWKAVVEELKGKAFVTKQLQDAVPSVSRKLVVSLMG